MTAADELAALYEQWRSLTEEEGAAIQSGVWASVEQLQAAKARLQPRITEVSRRLDAATHERQFRAQVEALMQLERRNSTLLQARQATAREQMQALDKAGRRLRQLHKSYVPPARTHWQSYS